MKKLYSLNDIEQFSIEDVFNLYKKYINFSQVELINSFGFGFPTIIFKSKTVNNYCISHSIYFLIKKNFKKVF